MFIFNCTTNVTGGAVQNAVNFIRQVLLSSECEKWVFLVNSKVYEQLDISNDEQFEIFQSPAKSRRARNKISEYILNKPDSIVYTSAGPAYLKIENYHVIGCSNPYILGIDKEINISFFKGFAWIKRELLTLYQRKWIKEANAYIFQTKHSQNVFFKNISKKSIADSIVVPNAISIDFKKQADLMPTVNLPQRRQVVNVLVPSAYYKHKCLEMIPSLILLLNSLYPDFKYIFHLTINDTDFLLIKKLDDFNFISKQLINLGPYKHSDAIGLYKKAHVIFQPSLIEVFSTTYIEAISMGLPLVVPDIPFARDICHDYPHYYNFNQLDDCVRAFSPQIVFNMQNKNKATINEYGTQEDRFNKIQNYLYRLKEELNV